MSDVELSVLGKLAGELKLDDSAVEAAVKDADNAIAE